MRATSSFSMVAVVLLAVAGCGVREAGDPFRAPRSGEESARMSSHFVRFEVTCDECTVHWRVLDQTGSDVDSGAYSRQVTLHLRPGETTEAVLSAQAHPGSGPVRAVRIYVDGDLGGETRVDEGDDQLTERVQGPVVVTAEVPPPNGGDGNGSGAAGR